MPHRDDDLSYDERIEVRVDGKTIKVTPAVAIVTRDGVLWDVSGLERGYTFEIDFRVQGTKKGPFVPAKVALRGRYLAKKPGRIKSNRSDQRSGVWKYDVVLRKGNVDVRSIDPSIIIRE
jgi:hypothetical protein